MPKLCSCLPPVHGASRQAPATAFAMAEVRTTRPQCTGAGHVTAPLPQHDTLALDRRTPPASQHDLKARHATCCRCKATRSPAPLPSLGLSTKQAPSPIRPSSAAGLCSGPVPAAASGGWGAPAFTQGSAAWPGPFQQSMPMAWQVRDHAGCSAGSPGVHCCLLLAANTASAVHPVGAISCCCCRAPLTCCPDILSCATKRSSLLLLQGGLLPTGMAP